MYGPVFLSKVINLQIGGTLCLTVIILEGAYHNMTIDTENKVKHQNRLYWYLYGGQKTL